MDYITKETVEQLTAVGFSYPEYQHMLNEGMVYWIDGGEYVIGGPCDSGYTDEDRRAAREGLWLPDEQQLLSWLQYNDFDVSMEWSCAQWYFHIRATDPETQATYDGGGPDLANALAKVIYKICKSNRSGCVPREGLWLEIEKE